MGRPRLCTDDVLEHIAKIKQANPRMKAKEVINSVKEYLIDHYPNPDGKWTRDDIEAVVRDEMLSESAIIKYLTEVNKSITTPSKLDESWHLGTLKDYPLPTEALPVILDTLESQKMLTRSREVTIRHAIWISRLLHIVKNKDELREIAWHYAFNERISEIAHPEKQFNTSQYDCRLSNPKELIEYFRNRIPQSDYLTYKKAFNQVTLGIEYEPGHRVDHLVIGDNKVYAPLLIQEKLKYLEMPYSTEALLEAVKKGKSVKSIKKLKDGVTVIRFKETISLGFENKEYNEHLHNFIKDGEQ